MEGRREAEGGAGYQRRGYGNFSSMNPSAAKSVSEITELPLILLIGLNRFDSRNWRRDEGGGWGGGGGGYLIEID